MALKNKLGITNPAELAHEEERISKKKAIELFENGILGQLDAGKFSTPKAIHKDLFDKIYRFAGKLRTVNISKSIFCFARSIYLESSLETIDKMPQFTFDEIIKKYVEMNIAHPSEKATGEAFEYGSIIFKTELHKVVDWSRVEKEDYLLAMERCPIKDIEIKHLLKAALTDEIDSREIYLKGIDHSYYYEDSSVFKTENL